MKKIVRIDLKAHEVARTVTWYQLEANREIRLDTLRCKKLEKRLVRHDKGIKMLNDALLLVLLNEVEYRKIMGINIIKSLEI